MEVDQQWGELNLNFYLLARSFLLLRKDLFPLKTACSDSDRLAYKSSSNLFTSAKIFYVCVKYHSSALLIFQP